MNYWQPVNAEINMNTAYMAVRVYSESIILAYGELFVGIEELYLAH